MTKEEKQANTFVKETKNKPIKTGLYIDNCSRFKFLYTLVEVCHTSNTRCIKEWAERALDNPSETFIIEVGKEWVEGQIAFKENKKENRE